MRAIILVSALVSACAAPVPPSAPLASAPIALPSPAAPRPRAPARARISIDDPACDDMRLPAPHGTLFLPDALFAPAAAPLLRVVCGCTRAGESTTVTARFTPSEGTVVARADAPDADACLHNTSIGRYPPFDLGSDCIGCGPKRYPIFHGAPSEPPAPPGAFTYSFRFVHPDR